METVDSRARLLSELHAKVAACRHCAQADFTVCGPPVYSGPVTAQAMVVGQAPSRSDQMTGHLWSGPAGRRLMGWLAWAGLSEETLRARQYLTAVTRCYPGRAPTGRGDRPPSRLEQALCRGYLYAELALVAPRLVVPVGRVAIDFFGGAGRPLDRLVGRAYRIDDTWIVPLPHPSGASAWLNRPEHQARLARGLAILRELVRGLGM